MRGRVLSSALSDYDELVQASKHQLTERMTVPAVRHNHHHHQQQQQHGPLAVTGVVSHSVSVITTV